MSHILARLDARGHQRRDLAPHSRFDIGVKGPSFITGADTAGKWPALDDVKIHAPFDAMALAHRLGVRTVTNEEGERDG